MMEPHGARRIDEHIAPELSRVGAGVFRQSAARELFQVRQPRPASPDVPQASLVHAVASVQCAVVVDEHGPVNLRFRKVRPNERRGLERHDRDPYPQLLERSLVLLQLQQVPAAGESPKVPVKHQQKPVTLIVGQAVCAPVRIGQFERNRRRARPRSLHALCHASPFCVGAMQRVRLAVNSAPLARARR